VFVSRRSPRPSAPIANSSQLRPSRFETKTSVRPSGDQAGPCSSPGVVSVPTLCVSRSTILPLVVIRKMSLLNASVLRANAISFPFGE
jgi:hypothetical protein